MSTEFFAKAYNEIRKHLDTEEKKIEFLCKMLPIAWSQGWGDEETAAIVWPEFSQALELARAAA